jgi:crossover junction endodeoxyribonuclease RusA
LREPWPENIVKGEASELELEICVPLLPPSVNHYVKHTRDGRHYVTAEAKAFKAAIPLCARQRQVRHDWYAIEIWINLAKGDKIDLDNCAKVILDGLVEGGQIHSDAAVTCLTLHKTRRYDHLAGKTCITIWEGKKP